MNLKILVAIGFFILPLALATIYFPQLVFFISLLVISFFAIYSMPMLGLLLAVLSLFLNDMISVDLSSPTDFRVPFAVIVICPVFLILLPKLIKGAEGLDKHTKRIIVLILFFFGWAAISVFWVQKMSNLIFIFSSVLLFQMILTVVEDKAELYKVFRVLLIAGCALGIVLFISKWYEGSQTVEISDGLEVKFAINQYLKRAGGFAPSNMASAIMNFFVFIGLALLYKRGILRRVVISLMIFFFIICSLITGSKMGLASLTIGLFSLIFIAPALRNWRIRIAVSSFVMLFFIMLLGGGVIINRFLLMIERGVSIKGDRLGWWKTGFEKLFDTYGIGVGVGGFIKYLPVPSTHNFYLSIIFDLGVIGVLIFTFFAIFLVKYGRVAARHCKDSELNFTIYCLFASLITIALHTLADGDYHQIFYWLQMGLLVTAAKVAYRLDNVALRTGN